MKSFHTGVIILEEHIGGEWFSRITPMSAALNSQTDSQEERILQMS